MSHWMLIKNAEDKWYIFRRFKGISEFLYPDGRVIKKKPYFYEFGFEAILTMKKFKIPVMQEGI